MCLFMFAIDMNASLLLTSESSITIHALVIALECMIPLDVIKRYKSGRILLQTNHTSWFAGFGTNLDQFFKLLVIKII
jgi:hypothetical protein